MSLCQDSARISVTPGVEIQGDDYFGNVDGSGLTEPVASPIQHIDIKISTMGCHACEINLYERPLYIRAQANSPVIKVLFAWAESCGLDDFDDGNWSSSWALLYEGVRIPLKADHDSGQSWTDATVIEVTGGKLEDSEWEMCRTDGPGCPKCTLATPQVA